MTAVLRVVDERFTADGRSRLPAMELRLASEQVTPSEIIRRRVEMEVNELNQQTTALAQAKSGARSFLVPPQDKSVLAVTTETQRALAAFISRRFIMLVDDRQIEDLDTAVTVQPESEVVFLYITPLKGG